MSQELLETNKAADPINTFEIIKVANYIFWKNKAKLATIPGFFVASCLVLLFFSLQVSIDVYLTEFQLLAVMAAAAIFFVFIFQKNATATIYESLLKAEGVLDEKGSVAPEFVGGPAAIVSVICMLVIMLTGMAFVIPGYIALCFLAPAVPACTAERLNLKAAFLRGYDLVKGHFVSVLGVLIIGHSLALILGSFTGIAARFTLGFVPFGYLIGQVVIAGLILGYLSSLNVVIYFQLRRTQEKKNVSQLTTVFTIQTVSAIAETVSDTRTKEPG